MSNVEAIITLGAIVVGGLIFLGTYYFNNRNNGNHHNGNHPPPQSPERCPICSEILRQPITNLLSCGHRMHKKCLYSNLIEQWGLLGNRRCPVRGCIHRITDDEVRNILGCPICSEILQQPITNTSLLSCGHRMHKKCLYSNLIKQQGLLGNRRCPVQGCIHRIHDDEVRNILGSRCCVCDEEFNGNRKNLPCGHGMHTECLEANICVQKYSEEPRTDYHCPYNLLRCNHTIPFSEAWSLARSKRKFYF